MLIKIGNRGFNVITFVLFAGCAGLVAIAGWSIEFFRPDVELFAELLAETRVERETAFVELALRSSPWFVAGMVLFIGVYLAFEKIDR